MKKEGFFLIIKEGALRNVNCNMSFFFLTERHTKNKVKEISQNIDHPQTN